MLMSIMVLYVFFENWKDMDEFLMDIYCKIGVHSNEWTSAEQNKIDKIE